MIHEFAVPFASLDAAGKAFRFPIRAPWVRGVLEGHEATSTGEEGELEVRLSRSGQDAVVHGHLRAALAVPCARCLQPVTIRIDEPVSALMVPGSGRARGGESPEYEFNSEEAETMPFDGETVVLDDLIRDELLLEIPMIPLCSEDCPGISPGPSVASAPEVPSQAVDPRLAPLLRIKPNKTSQKKE